MVCFGGGAVAAIVRPQDCQGVFDMMQQFDRPDINANGEFQHQAGIAVLRLLVSTCVFCALLLQGAVLTQLIYGDDAAGIAAAQATPLNLLVTFWLSEW